MFTGIASVMVREAASASSASFFVPTVPPEYWGVIGVAVFAVVMFLIVLKVSASDKAHREALLVPCKYCGVLKRYWTRTVCKKDKHEA